MGLPYYSKVVPAFLKLDTRKTDGKYYTIIIDNKTFNLMCHACRHLESPPGSQTLPERIFLYFS